MIQHPAILALSIAALLSCFMLVYAARYGTRILDKWDLHSGSELQLELERRGWKRRPARPRRIRHHCAARWRPCLSTS